MDYLQKVKEKEAEQAALFNRYNADMDLIKGTKYRMMDADNKAVEDIINITLNRPAVFFTNVTAALGNTKELITVVTEEKNLDTDYIEDFLRAARKAANAKLKRMGMWELNPYFDWHSCARGRLAARCVFQMIDGVLDPDIATWDAHYVTYELGVHGLEWAAYKTKRLKADISASYPDAKFTGKGADVLDVWDTEHNEVWIDKQKVDEQPHSFGYTPVVIDTVALGSMSADEDNLQYQGESIFFLIRDIVPEYNRLMSIAQTLNLKAVFPPMTHTKKGGGAPAKYKDATGTASITAVGIGEGIAPINYGDIKGAAMLVDGAFHKALEEGSLTSFDLGTFRQDASAILVITVTEGRDQVFVPRLNNKSSMNEQLAEMQTDQVIQIGGSVELGTRRHKRTFETSKLEGQYEVTFEYSVVDTKVDMARISIAKSYGDLVSESFKRREVMRLQDPDKVETELKLEMASKVSPSVMMYDVAEALAKKGDKIRASLVARDLGMTLEQVVSPQFPTVSKEKPSESLLPLLTERGGAGRSSAKKSAELQATPREIGEEE